VGGDPSRTDQEASVTTARTRYVLGLLVWAGTLLVMLFGIAALGIVGDGGPPDLMYVGAAVVGLAGAAMARFRPLGTALALLAAALLTLLAGVVAVAAGWQEGGSVVDVLALSALFAGLYAASAWLLRSAAPHRA
jgi:hypothetical protein